MDRVPIPVPNTIPPPRPSPRLSARLRATGHDRRCRCRLAAATLCRRVLGRLAERDVCACANRGLRTVAAVEGLAGHDAVDLCGREALASLSLILCLGLCLWPVLVACACGLCLWPVPPLGSGSHVPVRMFWNASSTLLASRAEVSMKDRWFSPGRGERERGSGSALVRALAPKSVFIRTCKSLGLLGGYGPQVPQIALVSHQHDDNVRVGMVA